MAYGVLEESWNLSVDPTSYRNWRREFSSNKQSSKGKKPIDPTAAIPIDRWTKVLSNYMALDRLVRLGCISLEPIQFPIIRTKFAVPRK